jgi:hypothetical protein
MSKIAFAYMICCANIKRKMVTHFIEQRGCSHEESDGEFCAICGAPMWENVKHEIKLTQTQINLGNKIGSDYSLSGYAWNGKDNVLTNENTMFRFYIDQTCNTTNFEEATKEQKEKITNKLINWLVDNEFDCNLVKSL